MCSLPFSCWKKVFVKKKYWDPADDIESIKLKSVILHNDSKLLRSFYMFLLKYFEPLTDLTKKKFLDSSSKKTVEVSRLYQPKLYIRGICKDKNGCKTIVLLTV